MSRYLRTRLGSSCKTWGEPATGVGTATRSPQNRGVVVYIPRSYVSYNKTTPPHTPSDDYHTRVLSSIFMATHDPPSGMSTYTGPPPTVAVSRFSGVRASGRLVTCVLAPRASSSAGPACNSPLHAHAPSRCDTSPVGLLARAVRDVPAPPRVLPVSSARSSRSESLCPGLSRFARSTARLTASRSPLERARLIAATAFFPRRCRHPIARTLSAPGRQAKHARVRFRTPQRNETRLDSLRKTEGGVFETSSSMRKTSRVS